MSGRRNPAVPRHDAAARPDTAALHGSSAALHRDPATLHRDYVSLHHDSAVLHRDAFAVLSAWTPPDPAQDVLRTQYLAHLGKRPDAMWRTCLPHHLTASALVVSHDGARVLLTLHRRLRRWLQTGGHCETTDRSVRSAALREATEESGIAGLEVDPVPLRLDRHRLPCGGRDDASHLDVQMLALAPRDAVHQISDESLDLAWFETDKLPETDASVRALVAAARTRIAAR